MSTARAEWVSAPTEMKSTPVSAMARTVARVTPPLASVWARPLHLLHRQAQLNRVHIVEQDEFRPRLHRLLHLLQRVRFHLHFELRVFRPRPLDRGRNGVGRLVLSAPPDGCP